MMKIEKLSINSTRSEIWNSGRWQIVAAFVAGMVITASLAHLGANKGDLPDRQSDKTILPEQQSVPEYYVPDIFQKMMPGKHFIYELVYAPYKEALIFG